MAGSTGKQDYVLGIDFGTTYTYIMKYDGTVFDKFDNSVMRGDVNDPRGIPTRIGFTIQQTFTKEEVQKELDKIGAKKLDENKVQLQDGSTLLYISDSGTGFIMGEVYVGQEVTEALGGDGVKIISERKALLSDGNAFYYCDDLKNKLRSGRKNSVFEFDELSIQCIELAKLFFNKLFNKDKEMSDIKFVCVGMTAQSGGAETNIYKDILSEIFKDIFKDKKLVIQEEPTLAALSYIEIKGKAIDNKTMLVIDIGGGTTDFSIVKIEKGRVKLLGSSGNREPGGRMIDKYVQQKIVEIQKELNEPTKPIDINKIMDAKNKLFPSIFDSRFKRTIREKEFQEYISKSRPAEDIEETCYKITFHVQSDTTEVESGTVDIREIIINNLIDELINGLNYFENSYKKEIEMMDSVLFLGGTSHIKEVRDEVCERGLNLTRSVDLGYTKNSKNIPVYCLCNEELKFKDDIVREMLLTYTNAVAVGAALYAWDRKTKTNNYRIKVVPKLELIIQEDKKVTLLDQEMITDSLNLTKTNREKGPYIRSSKDFYVKICKDGSSFPNRSEMYTLGDEFKENSEIILLADSFEEDQDVTAIVACDLDWLAENDYIYVYKLNDGASATLDFKENVIGREINNTYKEGDKIGMFYKLTKKEWKDLTVKDLSTFGFKKKNA